MLEQVRKTIGKYNMIQPGDRVLIGVSGGPDSVALLHVLNNLAREMNFTIFVAHLDHGFRGQESAEDAAYVTRLAQEMNVQVSAESRDVARYALDKKMSAQAAAREVRYCFFEETAKTFQCNKLATGHHANDQAETLLFNFMRGSGPAGLGGIPPVRDGWVIRPLIEVSRREIEVYCRQHGLETRLDKTNLKDVYTRNKIRLNLLPYLEREYNQNLVETLVRTSEIFREEEAYLEKQAMTEFGKMMLFQVPNRIELSLKEFKDIPAVLGKRIVRIAWQKVAGTVYNLEFVHLEKALPFLQKGRTGAVLQLPGGINLEKHYGKMVFTAEKAGAVPEYSYFINVPGITLVQEIGVQIVTEFVEALPATPKDPDETYIDYDAVVLPLRVRNRVPGDWFKPLGMTGSQKIKKYFIDNKVPRERRDQVPIIVSGDEQVVWIAGHRADRRWQAGTKKERVLKIKVSRIPG